MKTKFSLDNGLEWRRLNKSEQRKRQTALLQAHIKQAGQAPFYAELFQRLGISAADFQSPADLALLPFTRRIDLDNHPNGFQAVDSKHTADLALTSGTTGKSVLVPYTTADLKRLAFNELMAFYGTGVRPEDRFLLCVTLDRCFIAGLAYYNGLIKLGATAIRSGPGQPARQWELIRQLNPTGIVGVPSFLQKLANWAKDNNCFEPNTIKRLIAIGEPVRKADLSLTAIGQTLEEDWQAGVYSSHGATEMETAFCECAAGQGGHIHPELMLVEIVDEKGNILSQGEPGEVVVTPLGVEGFPLLRFKTGDVARLHTQECECGWTTPRLGPVEGRLAQRLKYKGTTLYPETIFQVLQEIDPALASYVEVRASHDLSDEVKVVIGVPEPDHFDRQKISDLLQASLRVIPEIIIQKKTDVIETMHRAGGTKSKRFFDLRNGQNP